MDKQTMAYPHNERHKLWTQKTYDYHKHTAKWKKPHHKGNICLQTIKKGKLTRTKVNPKCGVSRLEGETEIDKKRQNQRNRDDGIIPTITTMIVMILCTDLNP